MAFVRILIALASALLVYSGWMLQNGPRDVVFDPCPWVRQFSTACPSWLSAQPIPDAAPKVMYTIAGFALLFVIWPLFAGALDQPPAEMLAQFIQRGRDLHARCRKEGDQAVMPDVEAWTHEVSRFLRRLGHRYVVAFGDLRGIQLFASQYDTDATLELRQRIHRLTEFAQRFNDGSTQPD
jgi:hypothetical protein